MRIFDLERKWFPVVIATHVVDGSLKECMPVNTAFDDYDNDVLSRVLEDVCGANRGKRQTRRSQRRHQRRTGTYTFVINYEDNCDCLDTRHFFKKFRKSRIVLEHGDTVEMFMELKERLRRVLAFVASRRDLVISDVMQGKNWNGEPYLTYKVTYSG